MNKMGIDPGLERTGFAILNSKNELLEIGLIETNKKERLPTRLKEIYNALQNLIEKYEIKLLILERIIATNKIRSNLEKVLQARGCILTLAGLKNLEVVEVHPKIVKKAITGSGNAKKEEIKNSLGKIYRFKIQDKKLFDDSYDALAIGLTYSEVNINYDY